MGTGFLARCPHPVNAVPCLESSIRNGAENPKRFAPVPLHDLSVFDGYTTIVAQHAPHKFRPSNAAWIPGFSKRAATLECARSLKTHELAGQMAMAATTATTGRRPAFSPGVGGNVTEKPRIPITWKTSAVSVRSLSCGTVPWAGVSRTDVAPFAPGIRSGRVVFRGLVPGQETSNQPLVGCGGLTCNEPLGAVSR